MTVRPVIEEETVERVNEKLGDVMRVDPEEVGLDRKVNVLIDELNKTERELRRAEQRADNTQDGFR